MSISLKYLMIAAFMLSTGACIAQTKNQKVETVKIYGNCGMCESAIEKAGNMKNQSKVDWNEETNMATLTYDADKTNPAEILKRIALAGYDSDSFLAPDDAYAKLPNCCQYNRMNKTIASKEELSMKMDGSGHTMSVVTQKVQEVNQLTAVFDNYFAVKDALVQTNGADAAEKSKMLLTAIKAVKMDKLSVEAHTVWMKEYKDLQKDVERMAGTKDASKQRDYFMALSKSMYALMKVSKYEQPVYYQFCPMANDGKGANWLSKEETIKNPYYGSQMLKCGKTVETIK